MESRDDFRCDENVIINIGNTIREKSVLNNAEFMTENWMDLLVFIHAKMRK